MRRNISDQRQSPRDFHGILSVAPAMHEFFSVIERVARTDSTVLVRGETGTGKELVAGAIHACSARRSRDFRAINCATLTPELLASELFGHVKGSFTGAVRDHKGLFAQADGGTLFLDEIAELPVGLQSQLLRVVQERSFLPVGGTRPQRVDVRLVAATNKALRAEVTAGRFREDLMYRIRVVPLFLPPLIDRTGDLEALLWRFIEEFNAKGFRHIDSIDSKAFKAISAYAWPGNVRELHNAVEYAFAIGESSALEYHELPPELRGLAPVSNRRQNSEREALRLALQAAKGRKNRAAEALGISRSTLWRKLKEYQLDVE